MGFELVRAEGWSRRDNSETHITALSAVSLGPGLLYDPDALRPTDFQNPSNFVATPAETYCRALETKTALP